MKKQSFTPRVIRKYVGTYRSRIDGRDKAGGRTQYASDIGTRIRFPNLLYAKVLRSPHAHARIKRLDTTKARNMPGVKAILTYKDPQVAALKPTTLAWSDGCDIASYDRMMFKFHDKRVLSDYVCWVGDEAGVVVAAESEQIADEALRSIDVEWEVLPFVLDPMEAMKPGAPIVHPEIAPNNVLPSDPARFDTMMAEYQQLMSILPHIKFPADVFIDKGNVEEGFAEADVVVEGTSTYQNTVSCVLDNWCCISEWEDDKLTIWSNQYAPYQARIYVSQMLGLPLNKVRAISPYLGGQFGSRNAGDQVFFIFTAILAKRTGRPVRFRHSRRESFQTGRLPVLYQGKIGATKDGKITSLNLKMMGNTGAYHQLGLAVVKGVPILAHETAFAHIPNVRMEGYVVYTNKIPGGVMRGIGNVQLNFIIGHLVDALAEKLGMDPIEVVLKSFGCETLPDKSLEAVLCEGSSRIGWEKRHGPGQGPAYGTKKTGIGFSFHPSWHAAWQENRQGTVQVSINVHPDCTVTLHAPMVETGVGSNTCNVLGCAEALSFLGITPEDILWEATVDTESGLRDVVQTSSHASYLQSEVMITAAKEIKMKILESAATKLGASPEEMDIVDGRIYVKASPKKSMTVKELLWQNELIPITATVSQGPSTELTGVPFTATFAEVEVDTDTGQTRVLKIVVVTDCGTVMYASGAEAQQVGGQCIGVGESLTEEIIYDGATGVPLNFNWIDYKIPTMVDMPEIEPVLMEVWKGAGEYGACGMGEATLTCTPSAIANAVNNAIGARIDDIPITPEKVLKALGKI